MSQIAHPIKIQRLGYHYFQDDDHYKQTDLETWVPELLGLGASWIILSAPIDRAIPEAFISSLKDAGITPVLHFHPDITTQIDRRIFQLLLSQYARWGVRYMILFDRPNMKSQWSPSTWAQADLVDRFLDIFLPLASMVLRNQMVPIFPGLEPGGDYWDLAFLRSTLESLQRRNQSGILEQLVLGGYASTGDRPLDWGSGGPTRWPGIRPYFAQSEVQDHRGFQIYEWYLALTQSTLGRKVPVFLMGAGSLTRKADPPSTAEETEAAMKDLALVRLLAEDGGQNQAVKTIPVELVACCFYLTPPGLRDDLSCRSWFNSDGKPRLVVDAIHRWLTGLGGALISDGGSLINATSHTKTTETERDPQCEQTERSAEQSKDLSNPFINHYVLLPLYAWGAAEWDFELIAPLIQNAHPTVGFSLEEASRAERVTVVGSTKVVSEEAIHFLHDAGCTVERLFEDGTIVAS
jgi:hypothetical protein